MKKLRFTITSTVPIDGKYETILQDTPIGWQENFIEIERSTDLLGYFNEYIVNLRIVGDGAAVLRQLFYANPRSESQLLVEKLNEITLEYLNYFVAEIDLMSFKDSLNEVEVVITPLGLNRYIKLNKDQEYIISLPLDNYAKWYTDKGFFYFTFTDVITEILDKVTDGKVSSGLYAIYIYDGLLKYEEDSVEKNYTITTGKLIRLQDESISSDGVIKTTLSELIKALNTFASISVSIEYLSGKETLCIRPKEWAFDAMTVIEDVGVVDDFKLSIHKDLFYNNVKIGYPEGGAESETWNELEFIGTSEYKSNVSLLNKTLDITTKYRADSSILEYLDENNEDDKYDNDKWLFVVDETDKTDTCLIGKWNDKTSRRRQNKALSPRRILENHKSFLNSVMPFSDELYFATGSYESFYNQTTGADYLSKNYYCSNGNIIAPDTWIDIEKDCVIQEITFIASPLHNETIKVWIEGEKTFVEEEIPSGERFTMQANYFVSAGTKLYTYTRYSSEVTVVCFEKTEGEAWEQEGEDMTLNVSQALFLPYKFEFEAAVSDNFYKNWNENQTGIVIFTHRNTELKGFIRKVKINPANICKAQFELISTKTNDLEELI